MIIKIFNDNKKSRIGLNITYHRDVNMFANCNCSTNVHYYHDYYKMETPAGLEVLAEVWIWCICSVCFMGP